MKQYLISEKGNFYKANLHCHTTVSDGKLTPEEVKALYKGAGYSVVAFTDHDVFIPHHDLTDESFLALSGFEGEFKRKRASADDAERDHNAHRLGKYGGNSSP